MARHGLPLDHAGQKSHVVMGLGIQLIVIL